MTTICVYDCDAQEIEEIAYINDVSVEKENKNI